MKRTRHSALQTLLVFTVAAATLCIVAHRLAAQKLVEIAVAPSAALENDDDKTFPGGASLKTDPELERLLKRADQFAADGRHDLACVLWQRVLDESAETVMTREDWTAKTFKQAYRRYKSVGGEIERTIAKLPPEGLRAYRLTADGEAQAVLAAGTGERLEEALSEVTRRYFLSSHGDDAAFQLACLRMDRYDFVGASRLLAKILDEYPDPSVNRGDIQLRLAVAAARVGDGEKARDSIAELKRENSVALARLVSLVERDISREGIDAVATAAAAEDWPMAMGNPARTGHMKALPLSKTGKALSELWTEQFDLELAANVSGRNSYAVHEELRLARKTIARRQNAGATTRPAMIQRWRQGGWTPAGQMLIYDGLVYYKASDRLVCRNMDTGELRWMGRKNGYQPDQLTRIYGQRGQAAGRPTSVAEILLFGDRVHQGMTISDGLLYNIEGDLTDGPAVAQQPSAPRRVIYRGGANTRRTRRNWIRAYNTHNGKFRWERSAFDEEHGGKFDVGFLAAPVPFARFLIVPVSDNGALWLYALDKKTGKNVWKTFLCEEPVTGSSPWSPVAIAVDGGDAYVSTGSGVVFTLDALSGTTRWAARYQRTGVTGTSNVRHRYGYQQVGSIDGWTVDCVIPHGKQLVVLASDCNEIFALDRRTGEFLWESPRTPSSEDASGEYCLGVMGDSMLVAGEKVVRKYDLSKDGRIVWDARLEGSLGRGALTEDAVFVPEDNAIVRIDLENGRRLAEVQVSSSSGEPVGNLYTDGRRLLSIGLGRVYALTDLRFRLEALTRRVEEGDLDAQLERMRLRHALEDRAGALEDLRGAVGRLIRDGQNEQALNTLFDSVTELKLTDDDPRSVMAFVAAAPVSIGDKAEPRPLNEELAKKRSSVIFEALKSVTKVQSKGAAREILQVAPLFTEDHLQEAARRAMAVTAQKDDADILKEAIKDDSVVVRGLALAALTGALEDDAGPLLRDLLDDASDRIRLEAAWSLANTGQREGLAVLGKLLESGDLQIRVRSVKALRALTGQRFAFTAYEKPENRTDAVKAWQEWIANEGSTAELKFPIKEDGFMQGRTLICFYSQNKVVELDSSGAKVWEQRVDYAWGCQGLANGHRLVASYAGRYVAEFDASGKEVWRKDKLPGAPFSVSRLENGNTLVTCSDSRKVVEIKPDKSIAWEIQIAGRPMDAQRLPNGNTLVALQTSGKVVEVDTTGKVVWEVSGHSGVLSASRLENGNTLICRNSGNSVVEVDREGNEMWRRGDFRNPYDAQRLPNGNTLVVDSAGIYEIDTKGEVVWKQQENGASRVYRY